MNGSGGYADDADDAAGDDAHAAGALSRSALARSVAAALRRAVQILRWPALALLLVPLAPIAGYLWIGARVDGWDRVIVLVLATIAACSTVAWAIRRYRYLLAVRDLPALSAQLRGLLEPAVATDEALELMRKVAAKGGLLLFQRLRAVWSLLTFPDHLAQTVRKFDRARWFVPPALATSWFLLVAQFWVAVLSWPILLILLIAMGVGAI